MSADPVLLSLFFGLFSREKEIICLAVTIVPFWHCLNHLGQVMRCVCVSVCVCAQACLVFKQRREEWGGSLCYLQCHLIDLILVLLAFISVRLVYPHPLHSFPVPTATRGYWLHNSGACSVFVHVYAYVCVTAPRLGKSNVKHAAFRSS